MTEPLDPKEIIPNLADYAHLLPKVAPPSLADFDFSGTPKLDAPPFVLVDGSYYLFRCFHGLPPLSNKDGLPTNAIRGVLNALTKLIAKYKPTHLAVAFDTKAPTFRHQMSQIYKANRPPMDADLAVQIPYIHRLITALGIPLIKKEGFEADDIIGTLAYHACQNAQTVVISTGDKDMAQLVNERVILEDSFKGVVTDFDGVLGKFGIRPNQIIDYLTLMGDASDGILGIPKVGQKTAQSLLNDYDTIDNILNNAQNIKGVVGKNLIAYQNRIPFDKALATIVTNLELNELNIKNWDDLKIGNPNWQALNELYTELEFSKELAQSKKMLDKLEKEQLSQQFSQTAIKEKPIQGDLFGNAFDENDDKKSEITTPTLQLTGDKSYHTITNMNDFNVLIDRLKNLENSDTPYFAIDTETTNKDWQVAELVGISVSLKAFESFYIPLIHKDEFNNLLPNQLNLDTVLTAFKPILENPKIGKIGQHLKYDCHIFNKYDIVLNNWQMDTMLASYVINQAIIRHNLEEIAKHYLDETTISFEDIAGKGAKQVTFDKIELKIASCYACEDADLTYRLFLTFKDFFDKNSNDLALSQIEYSVANILTQMEQDGILVAKKFLLELSVRFDKEIRLLEEQAFEIAGEPFNLASPKQLGEILFDKLGLKGGKKTKTGQYSTSESTLAKLDHPLVDLVLEHRSLSKLKSTYTDALDKACDKQNRVHTSYHQALTSTGRLSSSDPNLQNIPIRTDTGKLIRQAFIAPAGRVIMAADYSQIELRLMAHFSGDDNLIHAFQNGLDIHTATASEILGKAIDDITPTERRSAKAVNFGLLYGMSQFGLAKQLGITPNEAKAYIGKYFNRYPTVAEFMENTKHQAKTDGFVETILGRKLFMPDINNANVMIRQAVERAAINAPLQGSASEIIKLAMIAVDKILPKDNARLLLQVHDELVFEVDERYADEIGAMIKSAMEQVLTTTAQEFGFVVDFKVPLLVEIGTGENWGVAH